MNAEFYRPVYLAHLFDWTRLMWNRTNWLFVRLDSNPNLRAVEKFLSPQLKRANIEFSWKEEGLWIPGGELVKPFLPDDITVPFSACYIFENRTTTCGKPSFNMTTLDEPFSDPEIRTVSGEIARLGALGYAADGCGLQWVSVDDELSSLIRQGFESWREAQRK